MTETPKPGPAAPAGKLAEEEKPKLAAAARTAPVTPEPVKPPAPPPVAAPAPPTTEPPSTRTLFWRLMNQDRPDKKTDTRETFIKGLQKLLVAGTMGALFTALVRSIPVSVGQISKDYDVNYTLDLAVRYLYLLWLLAYFVITNTGFDEKDYQRVKGDFSYDIGQSIGTLFAAAWLGFASANFQLHQLSAYLVTNLVIFVICFWAHWWFKSLPTATPGVARMRKFGGVVSLLAAIFAAAAWCYFGGGIPPTWVYAAFGACWLLLTFALASYIRIRVDVGIHGKAAERK